MNTIADTDVMKEAYTHLFDEEFSYHSIVTYSGHLSPYNAHIMLRGNQVHAKLSKKWRHVSPEIKMGLLQDLYLRLWKHKKKKETKEFNTLYLDLYHSFVKNIHIAIPKTKTDPTLDDSFARLNQRYFLGMVEKPNMTWGRYSTTKLGSYNFKTDTIVMSSVFKDFDDPVLMDVVMYHEMLHKHYQYRGGAGRVCYHDAKFKKAERAFENFDDVDARLRTALRKAKRMQQFQQVERRVPVIAGFIRKLF